MPEKYTRRSTIFKKQWTHDYSTSKLDIVIKKESTNFNYKLGLNLLMVLALSTVQMLRGSGSQPSMIGVTRCDFHDWALYAILIAIGLAMTLLAIFL